MSEEKKDYNPKENIIDPENYSVKTYLYDLGQTLHEIKQMLSMLVDEKVNIADYINDPILKKEMAVKTIKNGWTKEKNINDRC